MMTKFVRTLCITLCFAVLPFAAQAAPLELKFGVATPEDNHFTIGMYGIKKAIEKATDGRVIIHTYPMGQLASSERELAEGLQLGTVDITLVSSGPLAAYGKDYMFFTLPYLFKDEAYLLDLLDSETGEELFERPLLSSGIKVLGWTMDGTKAITNSKRPVNSLADLKGLKLRCMENPMILAIWESLGAVPIPMSLGEVFTALQQGTVDGQDNSYANTYANKYYEVQKYMTLTNHMICPSVCLMSDAKFKAMSPELQKKFMAGFVEGIMFERSVYKEHAASGVKNMAAKGVAITTPDLTEFKKATQPVYDKFLPQFSPKVRQLVEDIRAGKR